MVDGNQGLEIPGPKRRQRLAVILLGACLSTSACTVLRPVPIERGAQAADPNIAPGRKASILLKNGAEIVGRIETVTGSGISVRTQQREELQEIAFSDIQSLHIRRVSPARTAGVIGGFLIVSAGILYEIVKTARHRDDD